LREAIQQLKYKRRRELAGPLAELLWKKFLEINENQLSSQHISKHAYSPAGELLCSPRRATQDFEKRSPKSNLVIIPIPLHFKKEYERGFNQAKLLAQEFGKLAGIPCLTNILIKTKETPAQVAVENKELRIKNLENAFQINPKASQSDLKLLAFGTIILIDDVATTGATLSHAASALEKIGIKKIIGLVLAHGG